MRLVEKIMGILERFMEQGSNYNREESWRLIQHKSNAIFLTSRSPYCNNLLVVENVILEIFPYVFLKNIFTTYFRYIFLAFPPLNAFFLYQSESWRALDKYNNLKFN